MFEHFKKIYSYDSISINYVIGGTGSPLLLLLLHGSPQTHVIWHKIVPALAKKYTVVASDFEAMEIVVNRQQMKGMNLFQKSNG